MDKQAIMNKIEDLKIASDNLDEPEHTLLSGEIRRLKIKLEGMAISEITAKMDAISFPSISQIDNLIKEAKDAENSQSKRIGAIKVVVDMFKEVL